MYHKANHWFPFFHLSMLVLCAIFLLPSGVWAEDRVKEIRIADGKGDWGYPNPFNHYPRGPGYLRMSMVFDTLVWKDDKGVIPALAKSWRYDPDSLSYIFELQEGVSWHDGKPFTAEDVVFTILTISRNTPTNGCPSTRWPAQRPLDPTRFPLSSKNRTPLS